MIDLLATPSVCVIDEDPDEYPYILRALNSLYVGCVHIKGDDTTQLPPKPFNSLRLVFTDLYLSSGAVGKDMASHTANVFRHVVSVDTGPVLVVIWSKHKDEIVDAGLPEEDQQTEADLFIDALLTAVPEFKERLIFLGMTKPISSQDKDVWVSELKQQINEVLAGRDAIQVLWGWESLARDAVLGVSEGITTLARNDHPDPGKTLENVETALRLLVRAQAGNDLSPATAPRHLSSVLAQLLVDQLDHADGVESIAAHAEWLSDQKVIPQESSLKPNLNGFLLTMAVPAVASSFMPGTVYGDIDEENFKKLFGVKIGELAFLTFAKRTHEKETTEEAQKVIDKDDCKKWREIVRPVLVEVSPSCDVAQRVRRNALLIAGVIVPSELRANAKKGEAFQTLPDFALRDQMGEFSKQTVFLIFCSRYKATLPEAIVPDWLRPWFRIRELPTASLRNWHASHASRVGYLSL